MACPDCAPHNGGMLKMSGRPVEEIRVRSDCILCRLLRQIWVLIALGLLLLILLWVARSWLWALFLFYLAMLALAGLLALAMVARRLFWKICRKKSADPKGTGSDGHPGKGPVYVPPTIYKRPDPLIYSRGRPMSN